MERRGGGGRSRAGQHDLRRPRPPSTTMIPPGPSSAHPRPDARAHATTGPIASARSSLGAAVRPSSSSRTLAHFAQAGRALRRQQVAVPAQSFGRRLDAEEGGAQLVGRSSVELGMSLRGPHVPRPTILTVPLWVESVHVRSYSSHGCSFIPLNSALPEHGVRDPRAESDPGWEGGGGSSRGAEARPTRFSAAWLGDVYARGGLAASTYAP